MKLGFVSDSLGGMSFDVMLDNAARMGVSGVEVNTCGGTTAPHFFDFTAGEVEAPPACESPSTYSTRVQHGRVMVEL